MSARPPIRLSFLGGAGEIGASSALVTHAHTDHTGALPVVHEAFPAVPIHLTPPTADLVTILQRDALKIMSAADREDDLPLYTERQVESMVDVLKLGDQTVDVRCRFSSYSLSAHADRMQMVGLIEALSPSTVVLVHGDRAAKEALASSLGVDDIQLAADGDQIARTYNKARPAAARPRTAPLSAKAASALIGPNAGKPLAAASLAEAWLGHAATPDELARFVEALIELGVARRDDADPALLWSLVPAPDAILDEASAEARALKADNPKGRLLELCARRRLPAPEVIHTESSESHAVELRLDIPEGSVTSGVLRASSKSLAEQMAARRLLEALRGSEETAWPVTGAQEERLKQQNPKGRLLELATR